MTMPKRSQIILNLLLYLCLPSRELSMKFSRRFTYLRYVKNELHVNNQQNIYRKSKSENVRISSNHNKIDSRCLRPSIRLCEAI